MVYVVLGLCTLSCVGSDAHMLCLVYVPYLMLFLVPMPRVEAG
jgi:hypothetical protein